MRDYVSIGSSPVDEECAQVGSADYYERSRKECGAFKRQLVRIFGEPPEGAMLVTKTFPHDFGEYREVCVNYDDESEEALKYAFELEGSTPEKWDEEAREELR
jgi:hypothetical protein